MEVLYAISQNSIKINDSKVNILNKYLKSRTKTSKPKHFIIKSVLIQYFCKEGKNFRFNLTLIFCLSFLFKFDNNIYTI